MNADGLKLVAPRIRDRGFARVGDEDGCAIRGVQREKLGSTGIGHGIAIPHGKLPKLEKLFGLFARLDRPVDFESLDGQPVDLVFLLLAPEGAGADHLKALASVARLLRDPEIAHKLRESSDSEALYAVLTMTPSAAA